MFLRANHQQLRFFALSAAMATLMLSGCPEKTKKPFVPINIPGETAAAKPEPVVEKPKQQTKWHIRVDVPIYFDIGYIALIDVGERGNVLKIKSSADTTNGKTPAYYFHGQVEVDSLGQLIDQELDVKAYIENKDSNGIWSSGIDDRVQIKIGTKDDFFWVQVLSGKLTNSETNESINVTGEFLCAESAK